MINYRSISNLLIDQLGEMEETSYYMSVTPRTSNRETFSRTKGY